MNTCIVRTDQRLSALYVGLTAGGYDIAQLRLFRSRTCQTHYGVHARGSCTQGSIHH